jgi:hypothetical protein
LLSVFLDIMQSIKTPEELEQHTGLPEKRCAEIFKLYSRFIGKKRD